MKSMQPFGAVLDAAIAHRDRAAPGPTDYLVVDVLDTAIEFCSEEQRTIALTALQGFALQGEREQQRIRVIIPGLQGS